MAGASEKAAIVIGLMVEVYPNPEKALKDGTQSITIPTFQTLMPELLAIAVAIGKML